MSKLAAIKNGVYIKGRVCVAGKNEQSGRRMWMEFGGIVIGFEKRDVENGMETREVGGETELVDDVGELALDWERAETDVVEFVGRTSGFNVTAEEPDELVGGERGRVGNATVVVLRLAVLRELEVRAKLVVNTGEVVVEIGGSRDVDGIGKARLESGMEAKIREEGRHFRRFVGVVVVGELGEWEPFCPVVLVVVKEDPEVLLQLLIDAFRLSICLWVVSCG